ncbi:hypothetical protein [Ottowia sp.]|uniref:hypothetical protein n=1 Tax=Ottowia sp. TaxID=1898956 RepID=UPI0039E3757A
MEHATGGATSACQIQSDGSIPGATPLANANDLMVGGQDSPLGSFQRITGVTVDGNGAQSFSYANTQAVSFWGLGGNDFISGEQYDDHLDGGEGDDLIWGGAGNGHLARPGDKRRSAIHSRAASACWAGAGGRFEQQPSPKEGAA